MKIRKMDAGDYGSLLKMMEQLQEMHTSGRPDIFVPVSPALSRDEFLDTVRNPDYAAIIAECEGEPAGYGFARLKEPSPEPVLVKHKTVYIDDIFVYPAFRHQQIGLQLLRTLEEMGKQAGAERMDLNVWAFNENARRFYLAYGMTEQRIILEKKL